MTASIRALNTAAFVHSQRQVLVPHERELLTSQDSLPAWRALGLDPLPVPGRKPKAADTMLCFSHDNVPYCLDHYGQAERLARCSRRRRLIIERHHHKVKTIFEHAQARSSTPIWVLCGGGSQLQAFFGSVDGYLAILYLDLQDLQEHVVLASSGYLKAVGNEAYSLVLERVASKHVFEGLSVPGVRAKMFGQP